MKILKLLLFLLLLNSSLQICQANPVIVKVINEFTFDSTCWKLELINFPENLNGCYLTTLTDTSYFKDDIYSLDEFLIITDDSLLSPLTINQNGDVIRLYFDEDFYEDELRFGDVEETFISSPYLGQSISLIYNYDYYYFDKTPTLGEQNDLINAYGNIEGIVTDSNYIPIPEVQIIYDYEEQVGGVLEPIYVFSDDEGNFTINDIARREQLQLNKGGYISLNTTQQIWPDSTVDISIVIQQEPQGIKSENPDRIKEYQLSQNYPNPFNSQTTFIYYLPLNQNINISVYDNSGRLIEELFSGFQNSGTHKISWDAEKVPSGIYFYRLQTKETTISKKCILIK